MSDISLENRLLAWIGQPDYVPQTRESLVRSLKLRTQAQAEFNTVLNTCVQQGRIVKIKKDRYALPQDANLIVGTLKFKYNGSALLFPKNLENGKSIGPFAVNAEDTFVALNGDEVLGRFIQPQVYNVSGKFKNKYKNTAEPQVHVHIVHIIKRAHATLTGTLQKGKTTFFVIPDDPCFSKHILVADPSNSKLPTIPQINDKVIVKLHEWTIPHLSPEGDIITVLGKTHTPGAEFQALLHKYHFEVDFSESVLKEADAFGAYVTEAQCAGRLDYRSVFTITIDPDDAKDFDDALSIEYFEDGSHTIGVHIADVSAYVLPGSALDIVANTRGNSTYLVGCVIPMLPHVLSSGLCSLKEAEDRLTKSVFLTFNKHNKLIKSSFANTVIHSNKRLTYKQAYAFLKETSLETIQGLQPPPSFRTGFAGKPLKALKTQELIEIKQAICSLWDIASYLREQRLSKGSLDIDATEVKIHVDAEGNASNIERIFNDESHQLIEEFMLLANETVARALSKAQLPFISRVHDKPDIQKLNDLRDLLKTYAIVVGDLSKRSEMARLLQILKTHPEGAHLKIQCLRSLKQACYRASIDGHYGLNKTFYAHFTSPIRRYADLIIHRILDRYLSQTHLPTVAKDILCTYDQNKLIAIAAHVTKTEQVSTEAERESVKIKLLEYFERVLEASKPIIFEAIILDIKPHGFFVELKESLAYGLVHVSTLDNDFYQMNRNATALEGKRTGTIFAVGQTVHVMVHKVNRFKRQIDFKLVSLGYRSPIKADRSSMQKQSKAKIDSKKRFYKSVKSKRL